MRKQYASVLLLLLVIFSSIAEGHAKYENSHARHPRRARKTSSTHQHSMYSQSDDESFSKSLRDEEYEVLLAKEALPMLEEMISDDIANYLTPLLIADSELQTLVQTEGPIDWLLEVGGKLVDWMADAGRAIAGWTVKGYEKIKDEFQNLASTRVGHVLIAIFKELLSGGIEALKGNTARITIGPLLALLKGLCETFNWGDLKIGDKTLIQIIEFVQDIVNNPTKHGAEAVKAFGKEVLGALGFDSDNIMPDGMKDMLATAATALGNGDVLTAISENDLSGAALLYLKGAATQLLKGLGVSAWLDIIIQRYFKDVSERFMGFIGTGTGQVVLAVLEDLRNEKYDTLTKLSSSTFDKIKDKLTGVSWAETKIWGLKITEIVDRLDQARIIFEAVKKQNIDSILEDFMKYRHLLPGVDFIEKQLRELVWKEIEKLKSELPMIGKIQDLATEGLWRQVESLQKQHFPNLDLLKDYAMNQLIKQVKGLSGVSTVLGSINDIEGLIRTRVVEPFAKFSDLVLNLPKLKRLTKEELLERIEGTKFLFSSWRTASAEDIISQIEQIRNKFPFITNFQELVKNFLLENFSTLSSKFTLLASLGDIVKAQVKKKIVKLKDVLDPKKLEALSDNEFLLMVSSVKHLLPSLKGEDILPHLRAEIALKIKQDDVILDTVSMLEGLLAENHWGDISKLIELVPKLPKLDGLDNTKLLALAEDFKAIIPALKGDLSNIGAEKVKKELLQLQKVFVTITGFQDQIKTRILKEFKRLNELISKVKNMKGGILDHVLSKHIAMAKSLIPANLMPDVEKLSFTETMKKLTAFKESLPSLENIRIVKIEKLWEHFEGLHEMEEHLKDLTKVNNDVLADELEKLRSLIPDLKTETLQSLERSALEDLAAKVKLLSPKVLVLENLVKSQFTDMLDKFNTMIANLQSIETLPRNDLIVRLQSVKNILPNLKNVDITNIERAELLSLIKNEADMQPIIVLLTDMLKAGQWGNLMKLINLATQKFEDLDEKALQDQLKVFVFLPEIKKLDIASMKKPKLLEELNSLRMLARNANDLQEMIKVEIWSRFSSVTSLIRRVQGLVDQLTLVKGIVPDIDILTIAPDQIAIKLAESLTKLPSLKDLQAQAIGTVWEHFTALRDFIPKITTLKTLSEEKLVEEVGKIQLLLPGIRIGQLETIPKSELLAAAEKIEAMTNHIQEFQNRIKQALWKLFNKYLSIINEVGSIKSWNEAKLAGLLKKVTFLLPAEFELETLSKDAIADKLKSFKELFNQILDLGALVKGELWTQATALVSMISEVTSIQQLGDDDLLKKFMQVAALLPFNLKIINLSTKKAEIISKMKSLKGVIPDLNDLANLGQKWLMDQCSKFQDIVANYENLVQLKRDDLLARLESVRHLLPISKEIKLEKFTKEELISHIDKIMKKIPSIDNLQKTLFDAAFVSFGKVRTEILAVKKEQLTKVDHYKEQLLKVKYLVPLKFNWESTTLKDFQDQMSTIKSMFSDIQSMQLLLKAIFNAQFKELTDLFDSVKKKAENYVKTLAQNIFADLQIDKAMSLFNFLSDMSAALSDPTDILNKINGNSADGTADAVAYLLKQSPAEPPAFKSNIELAVDSRRISAYYQSFLKSPIGQTIAAMLSERAKPDTTFFIDDKFHVMSSEIIEDLKRELKYTKWANLKFGSYTLMSLLDEFKSLDTLKGEISQKILADMGFTQPIQRFLEYLKTIFSRRLQHGEGEIKVDPWGFFKQLWLNEMTKGRLPRITKPLYERLTLDLKPSIKAEDLKVISTRAGSIVFQIMIRLAVHSVYPKILSENSLAADLEGLLTITGQSAEKLAGKELKAWAQLFAKGKSITPEEVDGLKNALKEIGLPHYTNLDVGLYRMYNDLLPDIREHRATDSTGCVDSNYLKLLIAGETAYQKIAKSYVRVTTRDKRYKHLVKRRLGQILIASMADIEQSTQVAKLLEGKDGFFDKLLETFKLYEIEKVTIGTLTFEALLIALRDAKDSKKLVKEILTVMRVSDNRLGLAGFIAEYDKIVPQVTTTSTKPKPTTATRALEYVAQETSYYITTRKKDSHLFKRQHQTIELESKFGQFSLAILTSVAKSTAVTDEEWKVVDAIIKNQKLVKEVLKTISDHGVGRVTIGKTTTSEALGKVFTKITDDEFTGLKAMALEGLQNLGYYASEALPMKLSELFSNSLDAETRDKFREKKYIETFERFVSTSVSVALPHGAGSLMCKIPSMK